MSASGRNTKPPFCRRVADTLCGWWKNVSVEPIVLLVCLADGLARPTTSALWYRKVCLSSFNASVCDELTNETLNVSAAEETTQKQTSQWMFYETVCHIVPALLLTLLFGSWSDKVSRRIPLFLPVVGHLISSSNYLLNAIFPGGPLWLLLIGQFVLGCFGGTMTVLMGAFSYLVDVCAKDQRTFRIGIVEAMLFVGGGLSHFVSGIILDHTSYVFVYSTCIGMYLVVFVYIAVWLNDTPLKTTTTPVCDQSTPSIQESPTQSAPSGWVRWRFLVNIEHIRGVLAVVTKTRERKRKLYLGLLLASVFFYMMGKASSLSYLFLRHPPLSWTQTLYGVYTGVRFACGGLFLLLVLPVVKRLMHVRDTAVLLVSAVSGVVSQVYFGFCVTTWMVFIVPVIGFFDGGIMICIRSLSSGLVEHDEQGKVFALIAILENLAALATSYLYDSVLYRRTVHFFAGFTFVFGGGVELFALAIFIYLHVAFKRETLYDAMEERCEEVDYDSDVDDTILFDWHLQPVSTHDHWHDKRTTVDVTAETINVNSRHNIVMTS